MSLLLEDYLNYMKSIKGVSKNTINEYHYDLQMLFRFLKRRYRLVDSSVPFNEIDIFDLDEKFFIKINLRDLISFFSYLDNDRENSNITRARKTASVRSFFHYLHKIIKVIDEDPSSELTVPKGNKRQPVYMTLDESLALLTQVDGRNSERNYAIITLFLNCGMRISELVSIDIDKIRGDILTVVGKGNKERTVYLNEACIAAIENYLPIRYKIDTNKKALFLSEQKTRITPRGVQHMLKSQLKKAGLDFTKYTPHKLRHTAATLMYKYGDVDIRALQEILGHTSVATTEIYTHIDEDRLRKAVSKNPLATTKND